MATMTIKPPCCITPRLKPGVQVGNAFVSIEYSPLRDPGGRIRYLYQIDFDGQQEYEGNDLSSGVGGGGLQEGLESLLSFLAAAGESYAYQLRTGRDGDNADSFPPAVVEWAYQNSDELSMLACELEETPDAIVE